MFRVNSLSWVLCLGVWLPAAGAAAAEAVAPIAPLEVEMVEALSAWRWYYELPAVASGETYLDFVLTPAVFDQARADLGDLRLYDARGREVPYALRVRRTRNEDRPLTAEVFNRQKTANHAAEMTLDLRGASQQYHELRLETGGRDFRRRVEVEGSNDAHAWGALASGWIAYYEIDDRTIRVNKLRLPDSRFRYLRVRVDPDRSQPNDKPEIREATVLHTLHVTGEYVTRPAALSPREAVATPEGPGSAWRLDLGGWAPCETLRLEIGDADFARPYVAEECQEGNTFRYLVAGELRRRAGKGTETLDLQLGEKTQASKLRLKVTDGRNRPLELKSATYTAAARQIVFAREGVSFPVRLYAGNPKATLPRYDFEANLPAELASAPRRLTLAAAVENPQYRSEPKPFTDRWPWAPYVVLGTASAVLLAILAALAKAAIRRHDAQPA